MNEHIHSQSQGSFNNPAFEGDSGSTAKPTNVSNSLKSSPQSTHSPNHHGNTPTRSTTSPPNGHLNLSPIQNRFSTLPANYDSQRKSVGDSPLYQHSRRRQPMQNNTPPFQVVNSRSFEPYSPILISQKPLSSAKNGFPVYEPKPDAVESTNDNEEKKKDRKASIKVSRDPDDREIDCSDVEFEDEERQNTFFSRFVSNVQESLHDFYTKSSFVIWRVFWIILLTLYFVYFVFSVIYSLDSSPKKDEGIEAVSICDVVSKNKTSTETLVHFTEGTRRLFALTVLVIYAFIRTVFSFKSLMSPESQKRTKIVIDLTYLIVLTLVYCAFFVATILLLREANDVGMYDSRLLFVVAFLSCCFIIGAISSTFVGETLKNVGRKMTKLMGRHWNIIRWFFYLAVLAIFIFIILWDIFDKKTYENLTSLAGLVVYVLLMFIFSASPAQVRWRPVLWGFILQFVFALCILRWDFGYKLFQWTGDRVTEFIKHTDAGSQFVFGSKYTDHFFAFKVLPIIVFFSTCISILYWLGWMQYVIKSIAIVMQFTMGTTAAESLNAAGNIFVGQSEAPLLIRPLLGQMTKSEIHAVMTGGFATIAGSVMGAYISMGVPALHLISASVMSAPAALAVSKLFYPETKKSKTTAKDIDSMEKMTERNILEAAANGASQSIALVANIAVNLIAFTAMLNLVDESLCWFGKSIGLDGITKPCLSFRLICSYLFYPFAVLMGAHTDDCRKLAEYMGLKTFLNEFIAYEDFKNTLNNNCVHDAYVKAFNITNATLSPITTYNISTTYNDVYLPGWDRTLFGGVFHDRSLVITTYALCGFANFASIGMMVGALGSLAPRRKADIAEVAFRAMIAGNVACFMTACIAGLFYNKEIETK